MSTLLYRCWTKATTTEGNQMKYGIHWMLSRRAFLKVYDDHIQCGDWKIGYPDIKDAVLYSLHSMLFIPGYVLHVATDNKTYHFGLNWGRFWKGDLPFPVRHEKGKMRFSAFSILIRMAAIGYIIWIFWRWISA
jgi:hypothetical protein